MREKNRPKQVKACTLERAQRHGLLSNNEPSSNDEDEKARRKILDAKARKAENQRRYYQK
jgi:hypothetical protein